MKENIFITGGMGMVGREITKNFFQKTDAHIYLLIHNRGLSQTKSEILSLLSLPSKKAYSDRLTIVPGDITKVSLGIKKTDYQNMTENITHIMHTAASTRFDLPISEARKINVLGTKNVALLAKSCKNLKQFGFISTAYVSGKRVGIIREDDLVHTKGFVNTYEQSKYEAEILLKKFSKEFPVAVYRLSTVLGDSRTGEVTHFIAPHQAIRMMYLGLASMLPGTDDYSVDLISSDYAGNVIFKLFWKKFKAGQTMHIVHGKTSYTLREIIDESYKALATADNTWASRNYPKPEIVEGDAFDLFMNSAQMADNPILQKTLSALNHFAHQLLYPKDFDQASLFRALPDYKKNLPPISAYYGKVIHYCVKSKWGRIQ